MADTCYNIEEKINGNFEIFSAGVTVLKTILAFGDSNTYGLNPQDKSRFDYNTRWTGILDRKMSPYGFRVAEEGLCGRTTVFPDGMRPSRRGVDVLPFLMESHAPVEYAVIMLGTNDCKTRFGASPEQIANGIRRLVRQVKDAGCCKILIISPIYLAHGVGDDEYDTEFNEESVELSMQLKKSYADIACQEGCLFLAASDVAYPSEYDREHMDEKGHAALAEAVFDIIIEDAGKMVF
ncbi:GDSL-type esterase/lipase family protein [Porcipelethomonas sp.]|uniref:GDSL-type esterase/lipase family protein n=1 Tax=Porcipelethomonas sp. TaxID=2981675 RepID=UPI003EF91161